jgi:predicted nuclease of predicted toxin-antitoxin system
MFRFLVDTQLPPMLAGYLTSKGHDSIHTTFFENGHLLQDSAISIIAKNENRIIITKDNDFFERYTLYGPPPKILLLQFGNIKNTDLINYFDRELEKLINLFIDGDSLVIFGRQQIIGY